MRMDATDGGRCIHGYRRHGMLKDETSETEAGQNSKRVVWVEKTIREVEVMEI